MATDFAAFQTEYHTQSPDFLSNSSPGKRILLVDDAAGAAQLMARLLRMQGHDVSLAHDGLSAIETALQTLPQVVFLDLQLPDMHGFEVARALRERSELADSLLVAITGFSDAETRAAAVSVGFDEFIVKPAALETLEQLLYHPKNSICST